MKTALRLRAPAAVALCVGTLLAALAPGMSAWGLAPAAAAAPVHETAPAAAVLERGRELRFVPLIDGREAVLDAASGGLVRMLPADHSVHSFLRVTIRILQQERRLRHADLATPFVLNRDPADGLVLWDPITRSRLAVRAFGTAAVDDLLPLLTATAGDPGQLPAPCPRLEC